MPTDHIVASAPQSWRQEQPGRTKDTESDVHEARVERYSIACKHRMGFTYHHGALDELVVRTHLCGLCSYTEEVAVLTEAEYLADVPCGSVSGHLPPRFVQQRARELEEAMR